MATPTKEDKVLAVQMASFQTAIGLARQKCDPNGLNVDASIRNSAKGALYKQCMTRSMKAIDEIIKDIALTWGKIEG